MIRSKVLLYTCLLAAFACGIAASCKTKQVGAATQESLPEEQCAFYQIRLTKDSVTNKTTAEVVNVNVVKSKVRYTPDEAKLQEPNFLKIRVTYGAGKVIEGFTEHPLYKRFDLYSETGKIESKSISLSQGDVFLRIPYFEDYKKISITETVNFKTSTPFILKNEK